MAVAHITVSLLRGVLLVALPGALAAQADSIVGSRTPPVQEVIRDGENGLLVDFFSPEAIAERVAYVLEHQAELAPLRSRARETVVSRYDLKRICLPAQLRLVDSLQGQRADARAAADVEHLAGDKARVALGEEHDRARDVVGLT